MATKLTSYETALTLYGLIFSELRREDQRYFLGTIKRDFAFFLFALIVNGAHRDNENFRSKSRLIPRNFNEWHFGKKRITFDNTAFREGNSSLWNADRDYFLNNTRKRKNAAGIAVLTYGVDLKKSFDLENLTKEREIKAIVDWRGDLEHAEINGVTVIKKPLILSIKSLPYFWENLAALALIYRGITKNCNLRCSLPAFLRYFIYYAFASARIRAIISGLANDKRIGKVMLSDLDNVVGNSFSLWSQFHGLSQIVYPHGSPVFLNKNRYFEPDEYYVWTTYQKAYAKETRNSKTEFIPFLPKWLRKFSVKQKRGVRKITIVTAMEENLEIPFQDKDGLINYIGEICKFALKKNILVNIKSHKLLDWHDEYDKLCARYKNLTHVKKRWGIEEIKETDIGVLMNTSSTLGLQLLYLGIPVITCGETMSEIVPKHFSAPYLQFLVKNKTELLQILEHLTSDKEFYKQAQTQALETFRSILTI